MIKYFKTNKEYFRYIKHNYVNVISVSFTINNKIKLVYNKI